MIAAACLAMPTLSMHRQTISSPRPAPTHKLHRENRRARGAYQRFIYSDYVPSSEGNTVLGAGAEQRGSGRRRVRVSAQPLRDAVQKGPHTKKLPYYGDSLQQNPTHLLTPLQFEIVSATVDALMRERESELRCRSASLVAADSATHR